MKFLYFVIVALEILIKLANFVFYSWMKVYIILPSAWGCLPESHVWKFGMQWTQSDSKRIQQCVTLEKALTLQKG